ncbi:hypothetical protein diail_10038 [Diaporthe ilicicola]|nr:hypothetical protein diail_10038 [Diaporthe ilicicola]
MFPVERSDQQALISCAVVFSILPTTAVGLRLLAKRMSNRKVDLSDHLIIAACINVVGYQALNISCVLAAGGGFHVSELQDRFHFDTGPKLFLQMILAQQIIWATSLALCKTSILTLYSKIFTVSYFVVAAKITAVVIFLWMLVVVLGSFLICQPLAYNWDQTIGGHCGSSITLWVCHGVLNIVTDLIVLLLPMPYIYNLELALYKKLVLMATFGLGLFVAIISSIRLYSILHVDMSDATFTILMPILWSALEPCLAITLACIPLLRPLLGGRYTPTGTARLGPPTLKSRTVKQKRSRRFDRLEDENRATRLADRGPQLRSGSASCAVLSRHSHLDASRDADVELGAVSIKRDWTVEKNRV